MNTKLKAGIICLTLAVSGCAIYGTFAAKAGQVKTDNAYTHSEITQISAEASGRVTKVFVSDNQLVEAGQLLATIDDRDYIARRDQAQGALAMALAAIDNNSARIELQQVKIQEVMAYLNVAKAENDLQQRELKRYSKLVRTGAVSKTKFDLQKNKAINAKANLEAVRLQLAAARKQLKTLQTERAQLQAQQQQAKAGLELSQLALEDTRIIAPIRGVVGNRSLQEGKFIKAGSGILAIVPVDNIWLEANYKETQLTHILPGQQVEIKLDMFPDAAFTGTVNTIAPSTGTQFSLLPPDNSTGNFVKVVQRVPVKIELDIPEELKGKIVPGLSAEVIVHTDSKLATHHTGI
ncbi:HlyD family secretion protein [Photobacterium sp. SDRW27]|uniref:HlyD family secretion protein n=1 Tax=Photobacterium obscurum TaxID=2829490 RepID=UPI002243044C|nr:HlyD family secretion protein [Photobacterium obscurum]MCW8327618.1 HlyD family secretion protein [Photobacterium obscurum]